MKSNNIYIIILLITTFFTQVANASDALALIEKAKMEYISKVLEPVLYLATSTCVHKLQNKSWPKSSMVPGDNSPIVNIQNISNTSVQLNNSVKLKASSFQWNIESTHSDNTSVCAYVITAQNSDNPSILKLSGEVDKSDLSSINETPAQTIKNELKEMPPLLFMALRLAENPDLLSSNHEEISTTETIYQYAFAIGLCILLDINPAQCK